MAGHSKWANIQHRKGAQDAKRGKLFTKLIREITVSARMGGGDPAANPRLRAAIDNALGNNMTKDTVERAVKRGAGSQEEANLEEVRYEGYGPNGVAILVDCMTDNRNRTVSEIRHAFSKCGGNLGTSGSVAYLFKHVGEISYADADKEEQIMEVALDSGAEDVVTNDDDSMDVLTGPGDFLQVKDALIAADLVPETADITMRPSTQVNLTLDEAGKMVRLLESLEDLDDTQKIYSNANISEEVLAQLT
ncbi:MAG: YebC/PmpR family DNA-binding transcriptional regulator [Gammaproteobacteria bacterium]|nr:YebC/PmpR family DNA-binding transcriptional regulator [Gammaproteobacteria bacterium]